MQKPKQSNKQNNTNKQTNGTSSGYITNIVPTGELTYGTVTACTHLNPKEKRWAKTDLIKLQALVYEILPSRVVILFSV